MLHLKKHFLVYSALLLFSLAPVTASAFSGRGGTTTPTVDYGASGGQTVTSERGGLSCTVYRPTQLNGNNPVILWGNGTGASPRTYAGLLRHWASWGFVVVAANTSNAGTGEDMLGCLDWLERSSLARQVDLTKVGTSGHSQGGGGAIMAAVDSRVTTSAPIQGYTLGLGHDRRSWTRQHAPMLLLSGSSDTLVNPRTNHQSLFDRADVPVFWANLLGASHFVPTGDGGGYRPITTSWFLYQLSGNTDARADFVGSRCRYCNDQGWSVQAKGL